MKKEQLNSLLESLEKFRKKKELNEGLIRRGIEHISLKKNFGTYKLGDAFDKTYASFRSSGMSHEEAQEEASKKLRKYKTIQNPIIPKIKKIEMSKADYNKLAAVGDADPYEGKSAIITAKDGKKYMTVHGAGANDPKTKRVNSDSVDHVISCNSSGNGYNNKNIGKGSHPARLAKIDKDENTVIAFAGSGTKKAFLRRMNKELNKLDKN